MISKKLPQAELDIMKIIWSTHEPVTSSMIMEKLKHTDTKQQTVVTFLTRLEKKGFLRSEKPGKEREFYILVSEEEYMQFEARSFFNNFGVKGAFKSLASAFSNEILDKEDIEELQKWLYERK